MLDVWDIRMSGQRSRTDTRYGQADIDGRADTTEEEFRLQEDLTIGCWAELEYLERNKDTNPEKGTPSYLRNHQRE